MKIAYLTNQYPHVRHTFIRREIVALESLGVEVVRFSIRHSGGDAVDPAVVALLCKTLGGPTYSITIHGPEEWDRPEALSLTDKYENASFIVAVSDFGRCQVYRWCAPAHWSKVYVVRCGVDEAFLNA